ncbi:unnamed protein product [Pleuronectes platessa]|uniref:Uncharacterized protein n=1 Tax=Pleuronectes platessa TaxID=8262 RepID=A0A9N7VM58_PLEPL|nr:unnamed protein product [Pleuronectes platessa]
MEERGGVGDWEGRESRWLPGISFLLLKTADCLEREREREREGVRDESGRERTRSRDTGEQWEVHTRTHTASTPLLHSSLTLPSFDVSSSLSLTLCLQTCSHS